VSAAEQVRAAALALLARRDYSRVELDRRLRARGHDPATVAGVLDDLAGQGWLSEERLSEALLRRGLGRGRGPRRLEAELLARGVDAARVRERLAALEAEGVDWLELAREALRGLKPRPGETREGFRARLARRLERRGFPAGVIARVLAREPGASDQD
jgi:regulatory protein